MTRGSRNKIILILLYIVYPFVAFVSAVCFLSKGQEKVLSFIIIISFFGLLGYSLLPVDTMDITRHYVFFESLKEVFSFSDFLLYEGMSEKPDFFLDIIYWLLGKCVGTHQIVGFIGAASYFGLSLGVIRHWCRLTNVEFSTFFILLFFMFLALMPIYEFSGMRQGNANMLFLFLITMPNREKVKIKQILLLLFPCLIHFSLYPIVILYICGCYLSRRKIFILVSCLIIGFFFFLPLMKWFQNQCLSMGTIGIGIAMKIEDYLFSGEMEAKLYSGSVIRFGITLFLLFIFPALLYMADRLRNSYSPVMLRFHYFSLLFFSYTIFTSSSYILSRNLMLFKFIAVMYVIHLLFSVSLKRQLKRLLYCLSLIICISGVCSCYLGREYRTVNLTLFCPNLFYIMNVETQPEGYPV